MREALWERESEGNEKQKEKGRRPWGVLGCGDCLKGNELCGCEREWRGCEWWEMWRGKEGAKSQDDFD